MRWLRRRWRRVLWGRCLGREVIFLSFYFAFSPLSFWDGSEDDNEYMNADSVAIKRLSGLYSLFSNALRMEISIPVWPVNRQKTSHQRLAKYFASPIICIVQIFFSRLPAYILSSLPSHVWALFLQRRLCRALLQKLFRLVDLGRQVRASASIGVVQQHHLPVLLADHVTRDAAFPLQELPVSTASICPEHERKPASLQYCFAGGRRNIRSLQNQRRLPPRHLLLEPAFVESFAHGVGPASVSSKGD